MRFFKKGELTTKVVVEILAGALILILIFWGIYLLYKYGIIDIDNLKQKFFR